MTPNGNGTTKSTRGRLEQLLAHHEAIASAIRMTLSVLDGEERVVAKRKGGTIIAQALALEADRAATNGNGNGHHVDTAARTTLRKPHGYWTKRLVAQRTRTAKHLAKLSKTVPRAVTQRQLPIAVMIKHGYIERKGDGMFIRTEKPFLTKVYGEGGARHQQA